MKLLINDMLKPAKTEAQRSEKKNESRTDLSNY